MEFKDHFNLYDFRRACQELMELKAGYLRLFPTCGLFSAIPQSQYVGELFCKDYDSLQPWLNECHNSSELDVDDMFEIVTSMFDAREWLSIWCAYRGTSDGTSGGAEVWDMPGGITSIIHADDGWAISLITRTHDEHGDVTIQYHDRVSGLDEVGLVCAMMSPNFMPPYISL